MPSTVLSICKCTWALGMDSLWVFLIQKMAPGCRVRHPSQAQIPPTIPWFQRAGGGRPSVFGKRSLAPEVILHPPHASLPVLAHLAFIPSHRWNLHFPDLCSLLALSFTGAADSGDFGGNLNLALSVLHEGWALSHPGLSTSFELSCTESSFHLFTNPFVFSSRISFLTYVTGRITVT